MPEKTVKALPGRLVLYFAPPVEETRGGLIIPQTSQLRVEAGAIHSIGEPLTEEERRIALFLEKLQAEGKKLLVSIASGTRYFEAAKEAGMSKSEWGWLEAYRSYRLSEPAAFLDEA